ncbi:MAG: BamA/TamA family outer membrane protein [Saccharospirillum sp.]
MKRTPALLFASLLVCAGSVASQGLQPASTLVLPAIGSAPETGLHYGAYVMRQFAQRDADTPADRLELLLQGTTKGQFQAYLWPSLFLAGGDWHLTGQLGGRYWPTPYYGRGNDIPLDAEAEIYELTGFDSEIGASYRVRPNLRLGILGFADYEDIDDDPDNALLGESVRGFEGGFYTGLGAFMTWDTRDHRDWPTQGSITYLEGRQAIGLIGSDADFGGYTFFSRRYIRVGDDVIALGLNYEYGCISTPFSRLPRPSGSTNLRGADGAFWVDHHLLGTQAEYRATLTDRWAVTGFLDSAQVSETLDGFGVERAHLSLGAGIRYATMAENRFNVRLDVGWVDFESVGLVISVGEAF